jgi:prepilin-type N-terminal cleavage/methylation domain-containing protein
METYENKRESGFTLIELLIAIVVVGILAAVAIVGIAGLTNTGKTSACTQSKDGAHAASAAFYANQTPNAWPTTFQAMATETDGTPAGVPPVATPINKPVVFELPNGMTPAQAFPNDPNILENGWKLTMTPDPVKGPSFKCS